MSNNNYMNKYLLYKMKYINLKKQIGSSNVESAELEHTTQNKTYKGDINGKGEIYYDNVLGYRGQLRNGMRHGNGTSYYVMERIEYKGDWVNNMKHGKGKLYTANLTESNGKLAYDGHWVNDMRDGYGISYANGLELKEYDGFWQAGKKNGKGKFYKISFAKRNKPATSYLMYDGNWINDRREGHGISYNIEGKIEYDGNWIGDTMISK